MIEHLIDVCMDTWRLSSIVNTLIKFQIPLFHICIIKQNKNETMILIDYTLKLQTVFHWASKDF